MIHQEILSKVSYSDRDSILSLKEQLWWRHFFRQSQSHLQGLMHYDLEFRALHESLESKKTPDRLDQLDFSTEDTSHDLQNIDEEGEEKLQTKLSLCQEYRILAYQEVLKDWEAYLVIIKRWLGSQVCPSDTINRLFQNIQYSFVESPKEASERAFQAFHNFKIEYEKLEIKDLKERPLSSHILFKNHF